MICSQQFPRGAVQPSRSEEPQLFGSRELSGCRRQHALLERGVIYKAPLPVHTPASAKPHCPGLPTTVIESLLQRCNFALRPLGIVDKAWGLKTR